MVPQRNLVQSIKELFRLSAKTRLIEARFFETRSTFLHGDPP